MADPDPIVIPAPVSASLPNAKIKFLNADGTVSLPWWRYFQAIFNRTGGATDIDSKILAQILAAVEEAQDTANQAETDAQAALTAAEVGALFGPVALGNGNNPTSGSVDVLAILGIAALDMQPSGGAASALVVLSQGVQITAAAKSLDFTGSAVMATDDGAGNETITIRALLPMVTGDLTQPAPQFVVDSFGQCIGAFL